MKKIDKNQILSKDYQEWLENLGNNNHPKYNSSKFRYYNDIKMSLLHCQKGLCAYTEQLICNPEYIKENNWNKKSYTRALTQEEKDSIQGDLEHFDESLKEDKAWSWDNFFVVTTHVNCRIKGSKEIKYILKPDNKNYDPYKYLEFDYETGIFFPNNYLSAKEKVKVLYMIKTLGINCISLQRKKHLENYKLKNELGLDVEPHEYITAWEMTLKSL